MNNKNDQHYLEGEGENNSSCIGKNYCEFNVEIHPVAHYFFNLFCFAHFVQHMKFKTIHISLVPKFAVCQKVLITR
jgi:hypothetical protein